MTAVGVTLCCPHCRADLDDRGSLLACAGCRREFPVVCGIPDLRVHADPYIEPEADRAKGRVLAARFDDLSFAELVAFYYSITPAVPPHHARRFTAGLLAAPARSAASLAEWEAQLAPGDRGLTGGLLEIGCGTAPLLRAADRRFGLLVGIDVAFRWLVLAKKRLAEAGVDALLLCASAEALPLRDGLFDRVVADSVLEVVRDQKATLGECRRVLRPGGALFVTTPNRFSLGPDPHVGLWGGGLLPPAWLAAYARRQGAVPPQRRLLSAPGLRRLLEHAGFARPRVLLPDIPAELRGRFAWPVRALVGLYQAAKRVPLSRSLLRWIGPLLHAVAQRPR
ncbi:MAG TPA: methyltransferase domain-containing protein [Methylomirabilota bacterium]|nr:methyltransferase domain-containing protein [Methylomirabilota bacterium]